MIHFHTTSRYLLAGKKYTHVKLKDGDLGNILKAFEIENFLLDSFEVELDFRAANSINSEINHEKPLDRQGIDLISSFVESKCIQMQSLKFRYFTIHYSLYSPVIITISEIYFQK